MDTSGERPPELMNEHELVAALDHADADLAHRETYRLRLLAALDQTGHAEHLGARDTIQFIEYRYRLDHHRARRDLALARALPKYQAVAAALPDPAALRHPDPGSDEPPVEDTLPAVLLRPAQAEAIITELEKTPTTVPVADLECAEQELVRLAHHLAPADLRKAAIHARDILDTDGPEPEETKAAARETLTLTTADRGVKFKGYLANENAELLRTLIVTGARPHKTLEGDPDPRSREKRQADALTTTLTLAATALDAGVASPTIPRPTAPTTGAAATGSTRTAGTAGTASTAGTGTPGPANPSTANPSTATCGTTSPSTTSPSTTSPSAAAGTGADGSSANAEPNSTATPHPARRDTGSGSGGDIVPGFGAKANITITIDLNDLKTATADAIGHTVYTNGLSAATIRRLACDANIIPIVLGSNSEPLDVGRRERLVTKAIRRALNTRDKGCVVCGAPPVMCDAHHLTSWLDGGITATTNLVLLCRRDHTDLHHGHWHITITNNEVQVTRPTWADPPPRRGPIPDACAPPATNRPAANVDRPTGDVGRPAAPTPGPDRSGARHTPDGHPAPDIDRPAAHVSRPAVPSADPDRTGARRTPVAPSLTESQPDDPDEAAVRDATYLAIWGENRPPDQPLTPARDLSDSPPLAPWDDTADLTRATDKR